jgi:hypothetical protein
MYTSIQLEQPNPSGSSQLTSRPHLTCTRSAPAGAVCACEEGFLPAARLLQCMHVPDHCPISREFSEDCTLDWTHECESGRPRMKMMQIKGAACTRRPGAEEDSCRGRAKCGLKALRL